LRFAKTRPGQAAESLFGTKKKEMGSTCSKSVQKPREQRLVLARQFLLTGPIKIPGLCDLVVQYADGFLCEKLAVLQSPESARRVVWIDATHVAVAAQTSIRVWDVPAQQIVHEFHLRGGKFFYLIENLVVLNTKLVADTREGIHVWDLKTGFYYFFVRFESAVDQIAAFGDNRVIVRSSNGKLCVCTLETGEHTWLGCWGAWLEDIAAIDNDRFVTGSRYGEIYVWDASHTYPTHNLEGHNRGITSLCYLGDDKLGSTSRDCTTRIWDLARGVCTAVLSGISEPIFLDRFTIASWKPTSYRLKAYNLDTLNEAWTIQLKGLVSSMAFRNNKLAMCEHVFEQPGRVSVWH